MTQALYSGVDPQVVKGFERYLDRTESDEQPSEEEVRSTSSGQREEVREEPREERETEETAADETTEEETVEAGGEETATDEDEVIDTWTELSEMLELEPEELSSHIQYEIGDERVSIAQLVDAYRNGPTLEAQSLAEIEKTRDELRADSDTRMEEMQALTARLIQRIERHRAPEGGWDALREKDPGEYIRLNELQLADRADAEAAIGAMEKESTRREKEDGEQHDVWVKDQNEKLFRLRPDWRDSKVAKAAFEDIQTYITPRYSKAEIDGLEDAQNILTAWEAAQYVKSQSKKPALQKRLRRLPKKVRATARDDTAPARTQDKARQAKLDKFRKTGKIEDAVDLFEDHL